MSRLHYLILQIYGYLIFKKRVYVHGLFAIGNRKNVQVGDGCSINRGVFILGRCSVRIGHRVTLSARCMIIDSGLELDGSRKHVHAEVVLEDDVWIGAGAIVLPNVRVGRGSVIGAGSVVTKSVPAGVVVAGNPARIIRQL